MIAASRIRLLLVDDHAMVRQGLRSALECYPNIEVVGEAADGEEAIVLAAKLKPTIIVMDIHMSKMDGVTATRFIKTHNPQIVVLGVTVGGKNYEVHAMRTAGAVEVLTKDKAVNELYGAIERAVASVQPALVLEEIRASEMSEKSEKPASKEVLRIEEKDDY